jgi:putative protease
MGDGVAVLPSDDALAATFSRGFTHGWLEGPNHQRLVPGDVSAHRGVRLGEVIAAERGRLRVRLAAPVRRGDGVALSDATGGAAEQGGRVYEIFCGAESLTEAAAGRTVALAFGRGAMDWRRVRPGMVVWQTDDPRLDRQLRKAAGGGPPQRRVPVDLVIEATAGQPLCVAATAANGARCRVVSAAPLAIAQKHALSAAVLREQFARLGTSVYELRHVEARISGRPMAPLSILSALRRELIAQLDAAASQPPSRTIAAMPVLPQLRADAQRQLAADETTSATCGTASPGRVAWQECPPYVSKPTVIPPQSFARPTLSVVCRSLEQLAAACDGGADAAIADLADPAEWPTAVAFARARNVAAWLATPRIQQPADLPLLHRIASCRPDGVLVRNLGGLALLRAAGVAPLVADYTLNAVNELTAAWLCEQGCVRATAALDLSRAELAKLAAASPARWEIVIHLHVPLFHTAHCLFCANLSLGTDRTSCGGACRQGTLELEDRRGVRHRATADAACRNTIFHGQAQSAMESLPQWLARGLRYFRIELPPTAAGEPAAQWAKLVELYRGALGGNHGRGTMAKLKSLCPQGVARWGADRVRASGAVPTDPGGL